MTPRFTFNRSRAIRRIPRLLGVIPVLAFICLLFNDPVAFSAPGNQGQMDTVAFRTALPAPGFITSIDDNNATMGAATYPRELLEWIAFNGTDRVPTAGPELNRVDVVQLHTGGQVLGRIASMTRDEIIIDTGRAQSIPFAQVSAVLFCDTPCLVAPGVTVDPLVLATEAARLSVGGGTIASAPAPPAVAAAPPVAAPAVAASLVEDPLSALRPQIQAPEPTIPPTATTAPSPTTTPLPTTAPIPTTTATPVPPPPSTNPNGVIAVPTNTSGPLFPIPLLITPVPTIP